MGKDQQDSASETNWSLGNNPEEKVSSG